MKTVSTPKLKIGDIINVHGARLRLAECMIDAARAEVLADNTYGIALWHARTEEAKERARLRRELDLTLRAFRTEYLGPLRHGVEPSLSASQRENWIIQGTEYAMWRVE